MKEELKLILALNHIEDVTELLEGNEYQKFIYDRLISVKVELERQLTNLRSAAK
jgi:hypothetical protein